MSDLEKIIVGAIEELLPHYPDFVYEFCQAVTRWTINDWRELSHPDRLGYIDPDIGLERMHKEGKLEDWQLRDIAEAGLVVNACDVLLDYSGVKDG